MVASKFDGNATLSLWVHRYFTKDCFIDAVTSSCSDLFGFIASPLNWHFGGSTMVHPIFRHRYIYGLWFGTFFIFPYIGNFIIPTDFHSIIFQRGRAQPPCRFVDGMDDRAAAAKAGMIGRGWSVDLPREPWSFHGFLPSHGFFFASFRTKPGTQVCYFNLLKKYRSTYCFGEFLKRSHKSSKLWSHVNWETLIGYGVLHVNFPSVKSSQKMHCICC